MNATILWLCGICDGEFGARMAAEKCCSNLVQRDGDPMEGRQIVERKKVPQPFKESVYEDDKRRITA